MSMITAILTGPAAALRILICFAGLVSIGVWAYWRINKKARLKDIAAMREKLDGLLPSDPEYGPVRALYTSMVMDADRWGFFNSDPASASAAGSSDHSDGHHASDAGSDGGHH